LSTAEPLQVVPGVQAGTSGLSLTVEERPQVRFSFLVSGPRGISDAVLLVAQPQRGATSEPSWPEAPSFSVASTVEWPTGIGQRQVHGRFRWQAYAFRSRHRQLVSRGEALGSSEDIAEHQLRIPAGPYVFGLSAWDADGNPYATVLTQPASYAGREHALTFELVPTGSVVGSVEGLDPRLGLEVGAWDASGRRVPMFRGESDASASLPLAADGSFRADRLPVGNLTLRVGTPFDLERAAWDFEQAVEVAAGATARVSIRQ